MKRKVSSRILVILFACVLALPASAQAVDLRTRWLEAPHKPPYTMWRKAGRGITNVLLGWTEVAYQPVLMAREGNRWPVALGGGIVRGLSYMLGRAVVGVYEIVTFPIALPLDYKPIIEPEFVLPRDRNVKL